MALRGDTVGPGAYPPLSAQIPPERGLHGLDTVGPGVYQFPPKCSSESEVSHHFPRSAAPAVFHIYLQPRPDLGRDQVRLLSLLQYIQIRLTRFHTNIPL